MKNPSSSRRNFLKTLAVSAGSTLLTLGTRRKAAAASRVSSAGLPDRPNLLFIITDQERQTRWFPDGWEEANLPNLIRLKNRGVTFTNSCCNSSMCSPSRATLLTGLYPAQHGVTDTLPEVEGESYDREGELDPALPNLATVLKSAGYAVIYKGKWHLSRPLGSSWTPEDVGRYGFDGWNPPDAGEDVAPENFGGGRADHDHRIIDDAIAWLQSAPSDTPFALFVCLVNPHDVAAYPSQWSEDYDASYVQGPIEIPPTCDEDLEKNYKPKVHAELVNRLAVGLGPVHTPTRKHDYINFYGNVLKRADREIGRLLDVLHAPRPDSGALADTTVVFRLSDHGEMGLSHGGMRQKIFNVYEETLNVPIIVSNPQLFSSPIQSQALVSLIDIMPTVAALAGVPAAARPESRGTDFSNILLDPAIGQVQEELFFTFDDLKAGMDKIEQLVDPPNRIRCLRETRWKFARYFDGAGVVAPEYEMYDLESDPREMQNLAHPSHPRYHEAAVAAERNRLQDKLVRLENEKLAPLAPTRVTSRKASGQPEGFSLTAVPNPFKGSVCFTVEMAHTAQADIRIYTLRGELVRLIHQNGLPAGRHRFDWDGRDGSGVPLPSGVYSVILRASGRVYQKVITRLK